MNATDTLKSRKINFFVEPKAIFYIPISRHIPYNYDIKSVDGWGKGNFDINHIPTLNFGFSVGLAMRLSKYFCYEVSLNYQRYKLCLKVTGSSESYSIWLGSSFYSGTKNYRGIWNLFGISNGISYQRKKVIINNTVTAYLFVTNRSTIDEHNNIDNSDFSQTTYGNTAHSNQGGAFYALISEHKIGKILANCKITPYIGVIFSYAGPLGYSFLPNNPGQIPVIIPFSSIKITF